jgi:hypothetical protein
VYPARMRPHRALLVLVSVASMGLAGLASHARAEQAYSPELAAQRQLQELLERDHASEMPGHHVVFSRDRVACAQVVRAAIDPPLYPGTGVRTVLVGPDGRTYGQHGEGDLADLARACGWLTAPPPPSVAQSFLSFALVNGMLATHGAATVQLAHGTLTISVRRAEPLSGRDVEDIVLTIPARGPARLERRRVTE